MSLMQGHTSKPNAIWLLGTDLVIATWCKELWAQQPLCKARVQQPLSKGGLMIQTSVTPEPHRQQPEQTVVNSLDTKVRLRMLKSMLSITLPLIFMQACPFASGFLGAVW